MSLPNDFFFSSSGTAIGAYPYVAKSAGVAIKTETASSVAA